MEPIKLKLPMKKQEVAQGRHTKALGIVRRIRRGDNSLLQAIHELGTQSDVTVMKHKPEELKQSRAFKEHQQKLSGAISRLAQVVVKPGSRSRDKVAMRSTKNGPEYVMATGGDRDRELPHKVDLAIKRNALKCIDEAPDQRKKQAARKQQNAFNKRGREMDQAKLNRDFKEAAKPPYQE
jgi:hypothetical protein